MSTLTVILVDIKCRKDCAWVLINIKYNRVWSSRPRPRRTPAYASAWEVSQDREEERESDLWNSHTRATFTTFSFGLFFLAFSFLFFLPLLSLSSFFFFFFNFSSSSWVAMISSITYGKDQNRQGTSHELGRMRTVSLSCRGLHTCSAFLLGGATDPEEDPEEDRWRSDASLHISILFRGGTDTSRGHASLSWPATSTHGKVLSSPPFPALVV